MAGISDRSEPALVWTGKVMLEGRIAVPANAHALVILASAPSLEDESRDTQLIRALNDIDIAVLRVPLLTDDELQFDARTAHYRYDAELLAQRYVDIAIWATRKEQIRDLPLGIVGSSGGAAGAMVAATLRPDLFQAVVSIDGRTDLAIDSLREIRTPTLLVVKDMPVLRMNREALTKLRCGRRLEIVHGVDCEAVECVVQKSVHWLEDKLAVVAASMPA